MRSAKPSTVPPPPLSVWPDLAALRSVLRAAVGGDAHALLDAATNAVATLVGGRGSCVMLAADGGAHVVCSTEREIRRLPINLDRYPEMREAIATRRVVHAPDVATDPRFDPVRDSLPAALRSTCVVPIANDDGCPALLVVQSASTQVVDARGLEVLALLGEVTAAALAQAHADPDDDAPDERPEDAPRAASAAPGSRQRILIVEDDDDIRASLVELLAADGFATEGVGDGEEALRVARERPPHLVLLDVDLPGMDGFALAGRLAEHLTTRDVPLLFLSGTDDLMTRVRGLRLPDVDFMTKPVKRLELLSRVERALDQGKAHAVLREAANIDVLTGLGNLRALRQRVAFEQARRKRYGTALAVVVIDVDKLKRFNDTHGHLVGSHALASIGEVLRDVVRDTDLAVRFGGDEFVVLLGHATQRDARRFVERVRARLSALRVVDEPLTVSIGIAAFEGDDGRTIDELLEAADDGVYEAKRLGGNRVELAPPRELIRAAR